MSADTNHVGISKVAIFYPSTTNLTQNATAATQKNEHVLMFQNFKHENVIRLLITFCFFLLFVVQFLDCLKLINSLL